MSRRIFRRPTTELLVMRAKEMVKVHPLTDWSHQCSVCNEPVGIYPSGQEVLKKLGEKKVKIVCNRCGSPGLFAKPAPGALNEPRESIKNPNLT